jgi:branched-chain amino acid transport system permease protein
MVSCKIRLYRSFDEKMIWQLVINGLIAGSIYALVALGFTIIYGTVRFFHFAHGAIYASGAYLAWLAVAQLRMPIIPAVGIACLLAGVMGVLVDLAVYRPLRAKKSPNLVFLLASFGIFVFLNNSLQFIFGADIKTLRTGPVIEGHHLFGAVITDIQIVIFVCCLILALSLIFFVKFTRLGKAIQAVADDPMAASIVGIHSERIIQTSFFLGSILAGAAGILVSLETNIDPTMGMNAILKGIIAAVIGGIGSISGALIGGLFIGLVENLGILLFPAGWKDAVAFAILVLFLLFCPSGILGRKSGNRGV